MSELESGQEDDWAEWTADKFRPFSPMEAMDTFADIAFKGGQGAIEGYPKNSELIKAMANLTEPQMVTWVNNRVPDHNIEKFNKYLEGITHYHEVCCEYQGIPPATSRPN